MLTHRGRPYNQEKATIAGRLRSSPACTPMRRVLSPTHMHVRGLKRPRKLLASFARPSIIGKERLNPITAKFERRRAGIRPPERRGRALRSQTARMTRQVARASLPRVSAVNESAREGGPARLAVVPVVSLFGAFNLPCEVYDRGGGIPSHVTGLGRCALP
ncbi:hypothetical protein MRX96_037822 [Rhipicephalus microplus]